MGLVQCPLPCHRVTEESHHRDDQFSNSNYHLHSESSTSSLSSQPSLPSVPSLTPSLSNQLRHVLEEPATHHLCQATLKPHSSSYVCSLVLSGNFLYSGSSNGEIRAWNRSDPSTHNTVVATTNVKSLVVVGGHNYKLLFSAHQDHKIRVWKIDANIITTTTTASQDHHKKYFKCLAVLPTLKDRVPRFFFAKNYIQIRRHKKCTWVHHADTVSALTISNDGSFLCSASWDRTFKIWRTSDFKCLESVNNAHDDAINTIVLSHDGLVYTGSADKKIKVWKRHVDNNGDKQQLVLVATLEKHKSAVNALAFSTNGSVLYSGACDRSILVWEREGAGSGNSNYSMVAAGALRGHTKAILCLAVVSDLVCSGSADCSVRVWRRSSAGLVVDGHNHNNKSYYSCLALLEGHRRPVKCITAAIDCTSTSDDSDSGNSYLLYSGSLDCDIKVWQVRSPNF